MQNQNSGGWRYGNGSNDFLYKNEGIDNELLKRAAGMTEAPKGLLDQAVQVNPLDKLMQQSNEPSSSGNGSMGGEAAASTGKASDAGGVNQYGYDVGYSPMAGAKGFAALGPLGALAGLQVSKDPLGQFAYNALVAQENRDTANSMGSGLSGFGMTGGSNEATTSGGDFGGGYDGGGGFDQGGYDSGDGSDHGGGGYGEGQGPGGPADSGMGGYGGGGYGGASSSPADGESTSGGPIADGGVVKPRMPKHYKAIIERAMRAARRSRAA